jgi:two-component system response regulator CpxR
MTHMSARILIVDDDVELCELVATYLTREGFGVDVADGMSVDVERLRSDEYAMVILDVMMPGTNGFDVLRRLRAISALPVIMLTARGDAMDRVVGLELGADDYLPKPVNPQELVARIRAVLRRAAPRPEGGGGTAVRVGDVDLVPESRTVRAGARPVPLTTVEFDLLERLLRSAGEVVTREVLVRDVLGREFSPFDRSIDTHVSNLRRKLGPQADGAERIKGIRGAGYLYAKPEPGGR